MEKIKCEWCQSDFDSKDNRFDDHFAICPKCDDKNKAEMDKAMKECIEYENEIARKDQRLLNEIKYIKGESYIKALGELIESLDQTSGYSIVDKPKGDYQKEYWHEEISGIWVDQWRNGGYTGDDFAGDVYVKIKRNNKIDKYLKIPYSM